MPAGFNYSKWDKLELSDDEDTHPGAQFIEKNTLRRIKRESHEVKEHERQQKIAELRAQLTAGAHAPPRLVSARLLKRALRRVRCAR
jgi:hypothetical protein